jgi:hypothetical protein
MLTPEKLWIIEWQVKKILSIQLLNNVVVECLDSCCSLGGPKLKFQSEGLAVLAKVFLLRSLQKNSVILSHIGHSCNIHYSVRMLLLGGIQNELYTFPRT